MRILDGRSPDRGRQPPRSRFRLLAISMCGLTLAGCSHAADPDGLPRTWRDGRTESIYVQLDEGGTGRVVGFPSVATKDDCERRTTATVTGPITWELTSRGALHFSGGAIDATAVAGERFGVVWSQLNVDFCGALDGVTWTEGFYETGPIPMSSPS